MDNLIISEKQIKNRYGIGNESAELFVEDVKVGNIDSIYQFLYARVQIKKQKLKGCKIRFNDQFIKINSEGELQDCPYGMFDTVNNLLLELI